MTIKRIDTLTLIITTITLLLMLFVAWKVSTIVNHVNQAIVKIENAATNPINRAEHKAEDLVKKELQKGVNKLKGGE